MMWIKGCPRCRGDLFEERNLGDTDIVCLQCGHRVLWRRGLRPVVVPVKVTSVLTKPVLRTEEPRR